MAKGRPLARSGRQRSSRLNAPITRGAAPTLLKEMDRPSFPTSEGLRMIIGASPGVLVHLRNDFMCT